MTTWGKLPEIFLNPGRYLDAAGWAPNFDVLSYGYDSGINRGDDRNAEASGLADLLAALRIPGRLNASYQSIVVIAHSMGGLLVQQRDASL